jgi:hypothetical protein
VTRCPWFRRHCRAALAIAAACAVACAVQTARAQTARAQTAPLDEATEPPSGGARGAGSPLQWTWRRFGAGDVVVAATGATLAIAAVVIGPGEDTTSDPQLGVDAQVRRALRPDSFQVRRAWRDTSDVLLTVDVSYPILGDALVNAAWYRDSPDVATQLALIDTEAFLLTLGIQQSFANYVGRQRPHGAVCGTDELPADTAACEVRDRYRSFFSGHTSLAFTAAALTCTHHRHLQLHGGRAEWVPCAAGVTLASATGTMRILGDRHYFTDVMAGAAVGSLVGWVVPFVHYQMPSRPSRAQRRQAVRLLVLPMPGGLQLQGRF